MRKLILIGICIVVAGGWLLASEVTHDKLGWRVDAVSNKLTGRMPEVGWPRLGSALIPAGLRSPEAALTSGFIQFARSDEGPCSVVWDTPLRPIWGARGDESLLEFLAVEQFAVRLYERDGVSIQPGDTVLDVGGHLGTFTAVALASGAAKVVVFEPDPSNIACFKKSFASEIQAGSVVLIEAAAWETETELTFELNDNSARGKIDDVGDLSFTETGVGAELKVQAVTIDAVAERLGLERIDFIKMDIEGSERHALKGAAKTLAKSKPRMALCVYHREDDPQVIPELVGELNPAYESSIADAQAYFH